jgi:hypothetical protein
MSNTLLDNHHALKFVLSTVQHVISHTHQAQSPERTAHPATAKQPAPVVFGSTDIVAHALQEKQH